MGSRGQSQPKAQYNQALTAAKTPSPYDQKLGEMSMKTLNWADKGDFTNPSEGGIFVNFADPAARRRQRELEMGAGAQGIFALGGGGDANLLALDKQNRADEQTRDDSAQYESDVRQGVGAAMGVAGDLGHEDLSRKLGVLGATENIYRQDMQRPKWWQVMIQGMQNAAQSAAAAGG